MRTHLEVAYMTPHQIADAMDNSRELYHFFGYLKGRLTENLSVADCNVLLAGLDVVARLIVQSTAMVVKSTARGLLVQQSSNTQRVLLAETHLACCDYLADRLRAKRRTVVFEETQRLLSDRTSSVTQFVSSVVSPMLSRRWVPWACYEPAVGAGEADTRKWQGEDLPYLGDNRSELLQYCDCWTARLTAAARGAASSKEALRCVISVLRTNAFDGAPSRATASYLDAALSVYINSPRAKRKTHLEVPILLVRENQTEWKPGHVLTALLVPFQVPCTSGLTKQSLVPGVDAVNSYFSDDCSPPEPHGLVVGDLPGGVYCPGGASCVGTDHGCEYGSGARGQFDGPSAGPSLASLLAADALGWQMAPDTCATAELDRNGQVMALSDEQSDDEDPYLQAKGRTLALFAHAAGVVDFRVVVHSSDLSALKKGADSYRKNIQSPQEKASIAREQNWSISWNPVSCLRDSLDYLLRPLYPELIRNLSGRDRTDNRLAVEAAREILADQEVSRWVIYVPVQTDRVTAGGWGFESDLAREIYQSSRTGGGAARIPVGLSAEELYMKYSCIPASHRPRGMLGATIARLAGIALPTGSAATQRRHRITHIERDLSHGHLVLILQGLTGSDRGPMTEGLLHDLTSEDNICGRVRVRCLVTVIRQERDAGMQPVEQILKQYGFRQWRADDSPSGHDRIQSDTPTSWRLSRNG